MNKRNFVVALLAALALAAVAAGCGGGSDSSSSGLSKAAFVKQADAICKSKEAASNKEIEAFVKEEGIKGEPSEAQQVELVEKFVLPSVGEQSEAISELGLPEGEEEKAEELVSTLEENLEEAEDEPEGIVKGKNPFGPATKMASEFGMKDCGS